MFMNYMLWCFFCCLVFFVVVFFFVVVVFFFFPAATSLFFGFSPLRRVCHFLRQTDPRGGRGPPPSSHCRAADRRSRRAFGYFISATTDAFVGVSGTLIEPLMIPLRVFWISFHTGPGMYFVCISETPLLRPSV